MQEQPYIDISGEARIEEILNNEENFVFDAFACENMEGWTPDIGLTEYPRRSIYRPKAVVQAGIPSSIRHRFHETFRGVTDHSGKKWIGVVIYDASGEECPLEFRLGASNLGCVVPWRHDNRRHLIVLDQPAEFRKDIEVFQVIAPGKGTYRIESFVLLPRRPEPSTFEPCIERLSARLVETTGGTATVELHFTTTQMARCSVRYGLVDKRDGDPEPVEVQPPQDAPHLKLHVITLKGLLPDRSYFFDVEAIEREGARSKKSITFKTADPDAQPIVGELSVPLEIIRLNGGTHEVPLTFGLPLPQGALRGNLCATLQVDGTDCETQVRTHSRWPDGTCRWVLVDALTAAQGPGQVSISVNSEKGTVSSDQGVDTNDSEGITVTGNRFRLRVHANGKGFPFSLETQKDGNWKALWEASEEQRKDWVVAELANGQILRSGKPTDFKVEESGTHRNAVRFFVPLVSEAGIAHLRINFRLHLYRQLPLLKITQRLEVISPALPPAKGGRTDPDAPGRKDIENAVVGTENEEETLLLVKSVEQHFPWSGIKAVGFEEDSWEMEKGSWRLVHEHDLGASLQAGEEKLEKEGHHSAHLLLRTGEDSFAFGMRKFWETCPKGLRVDSDGITAELLPVLSGEPLPGDDDAWHRLYFWHQDGCYKLKSGMALTSELMLAAVDEPNEAEEIFDWLEQPPIARPEIAWLNQARVWSTLAPKQNSAHPVYEEMMDVAYGEWMKDREWSRTYGFFNFGDYYGENSAAWGNNEYDPAYVFTCEYLRGGNPRWMVLANESARHLADVDSINYSANTDETGSQYMHIAGHAGGLLPPFFRYKVAGSKCVPSHMWVEGSVLQYLLTGDESLRDTLDKTAHWLLGNSVESYGGLEYYDFRNCREVGWHLTHLCGLARMSDDPRYLNAASIIIERVLERQEPGGGWERLLKKGHCSHPPPRCRGEAGFMVGVLLSGLRRYHEVTGDKRVADAITGGVRWLLEKTYLKDKKIFKYTSCTRPRPLEINTDRVKQIIEGLGYAYSLNHDPELGEILQQSLKYLGTPRRAEPEPGRINLGKGLCVEARYVPTLLANISSYMSETGSANSS